MYQAVHYTFQPGENQYHFFLRDDQKGISKFKYWPQLYKLDDQGEHTTLFGDKCSPLPPGKYDKTDPNIYEKDIPRELVILRDLYYESDEVPSFHNILYLDIEIEILGALTYDTIRNAESEITAISVEDIKTKQYFCYILDKKQEIPNSHVENKYIVSCKSEKELMLKFLDKWQEINPTIVVHFNGDYFDIPYLYYRIKKKLGDEVYRLSPAGLIEENLYNPTSPIKIALVNSLDFMLLFKKYMQKEEPSYKLGDLGLKYVNLGKIEYEGSLDKLFKEDVNKFIEYNLRDVEIIEALDNKFKFVDLTIMMSHICHTPYESVYYNTILNEGAVLTHLKRKGIIAPNKPTTINPSIKEIVVGDEVVNQKGTPTVEGIVHSVRGDDVTIKKLSGTFITRSFKTIKLKQSYPGGFLLEPKPGLYEYLYDEDVTSMYPFITITLNMGIETLIGRIVLDSPFNCWMSLKELKEMDPEQEVEFEIFDYKTYILKNTNISIKRLLKTIEKQKWNISANGVCFRSDIKSAVAEIIENGFNTRSKYKKKYKQALKSGSEEEQTFFYNYQWVWKIFINGNYGTNAINAYRFTDGHKIIVSAITNCGQRIIQESIHHLNEEIHKEIDEI